MFLHHEGFVERGFDHFHHFRVVKVVNDVFEDVAIGHEAEPTTALATGEARLSSYRKGRPTELAKGLRKPRNEWGILKILAAGPRITAEWDGESLLEAVDPNPAAGKSGMATAGPGVVSFDEFVLDPAAEPGR